MSARALLACVCGLLLALGVSGGIRLGGSSGSVAARSPGAHPANALPVRFAATGAVLDGGVMRLRLSGIGRHTRALTPLPPLAASLGARRATYARRGATEWYARRSGGVEQLFTIDHRPQGSGPLLLAAGRLGVGAQPTLARGGETLAVLAQGGRSLLSYGGLAVTDATGRRLRASIVLSGREVLLRIDDGGARYPLHVDPYVQEQVITAPTSQSDEYFGYSVAVDGNTMVIGDPGAETNDVGAALVYTQTSPGMWTETQQLMDGTTDSDGFGQSVAIDGTTIVVGAPAAPDGTQNSDKGAAYVFTESGGTWTLATSLHPDNLSYQANFGISVAISGNTIALGAFQQDDTNTYKDPGAVYVFTGSGSTWTQSAELEASPSVPDSFLGTAVAISGTTIFTGATYADSNEGAVYAFTEASISDDWAGADVTQSVIDDPAGADADRAFGTALAVDGSTLVVGADETNATLGNGVGFVYTEPASGGWAAVGAPAATLNGAQANGDEFLVALAISGPTIVMGSGDEADVYTEPAGGWSGSPQPTTSLPFTAQQVSDGVGADAVAITGSTILVGDSYFDDRNGVVFSFLSPMPTYTLTVTDAGSGSGTVTSTDGGIDCGGTCSVSYDSGTVVTLTATPASGSTFAGWSGAGCTGTSTCTVTMNAAEAVTATFTTAPTTTTTTTTSTTPTTTTTSTAPPVVPKGTVPGNLGAPVITGTALPGRTLTCSTGVWSGDPIGYAYRWELAGVPIPGADGSTFVVGIADEADGPSDALTCTVVAVNATGASAPATSAGVIVGVLGTSKCPLPKGVLAGSAVGPLQIGEARSAARHALPIYKVTQNRFDNFCLYAGWGIRAAYPSSALLGRFPAKVRSALTGRIVIALTANPFYNFDGVRPGVAIAAVSARLKLGKPIHIGTNDWYIAPGRPCQGVFKVRGGIIQEVGLANRALTATRAEQIRFLHSFKNA